MNQKPKLWTKDFVMVSMSNFLLFISFYILMVTLAVYSIDKFHASQSEAGLASSIFVLGAVIVRPVAGRMIERVGKKRLLLFGLSLFLIMMLLYFPINSLPLLLLIRFIHGFAFGIATTATGTIAADIIPMSRRGEGMGYFATSVNLAMAVGPFLGLFISQNFNHSVIFVVTTFFSVIAIIATLFLHIPKVNTETKPTQMKKGFHPSDYFEKSTIPIAILVAIFGFAYSSILSFLSTYAEEIHLADAASFFFVMYAVFLLLTRPFTGKWYDLKGENKIIYPSIFLFGLGIIILSQAQHGITLLIAGAVIGIGFGTFQSSAQTVAVNLAPRNRIGLATSTFFVFYDFGIGVGPFLLGFILPLIGFRSLYMSMAAIVFFGIILYYLVHGKKASKLQKENQQSKDVKVG
ncbi:MFS transporter [Niallia endozanthoxylica]|uniref:MFS transporter n=1 Tax=Niallia endozanthoxylica TaxID=2036016 RepID=A0A5J5HXU4_9BACI|nr:MFS transporter [Niallia endozanthoxylica]KAA9026954.1 MFS transporter [Niallia endozanthoxylica]